MKRYLLFIFVIMIIVSSCSLRAIKNKRSFEIKPAINYKAHNKTAEILSVKAVNCDNRFDSYLFYYKKGAYEFEPYATVQWLEPPCDMVKTAIINAVNFSGMFKIAHGGSVYTPENYQLLFSIEDLEPVFNKEKYIMTNIRFTLINTDKNIILGSYDFRQKMPIKVIKINNIVDKINLSVKSAIERMSLWMDNLLSR